MSASTAPDDLHARAEARVGQTIGKYRLDRVLGIGGMAVVYAATHKNQRRVAVKMLRLELSFVSEIRTRFLREGYVANTVDHPGAVAVLDEDVAEDGSAFLVMELLEGKALDTIAEARGSYLPDAVVLAIGDQLLDVLAAAHTKNVIHRDLKPANIFITRDGTLKVLDFGIARLRDSATSAGDATRSGVMMGTPAFMGPEQAYGKTHEIDARTDIWSAGATLFHLLTGRNVHVGTSASELLIKAATVPPPSLISVRPETHPRIAALIDKALAFERDARWSSAADMRQELLAVTREVLPVAPSTRETLSRLLASVSDPASVAPLPSIASPSSISGVSPTMHDTDPKRQLASSQPSSPGAPVAAQSAPSGSPTPASAAPASAAKTPSTLTSQGAESQTGAPLSHTNPPNVPSPPTPPTTVRSALLGAGAAVAIAAVAAGVLFFRGAASHRPTSAAQATPSAPAAVAAPTASQTAPAPESPPTSPGSSASSVAPGTSPALAASPVALPAAVSAPRAAKPGASTRTADPPPRASSALPAAASTPKPAHPPKAADDDLFHP